MTPQDGMIVDSLALALVEPVGYQEAVAGVAGVIKASSARVYRSDARLFATWLREHDYQELTRDALIAYHQHLRTYKPNTAARKWSVVRRIVEEQVYRGILPINPAQGIKGYQKRESFKHIALTDEEARKLLAQVDRTTKLGMRDYTMLRMLLRLGLRRSECAKLIVSDMAMQQGHHTLLIRQSKEDKDRLLKIPVDLWRNVIDYLEACECVVIPQIEGKRVYEHLVWQVGDEHPLFVQFDRGDHPTHRPISDDVVYRTVKHYGKIAEIEKITAHSMRASFITLTLEARPDLLLQVQDAAGHADPRTTRNYHKRRQNFDKSAMDVLDI